MPRHEVGALLLFSRISACFSTILYITNLKIIPSELFVSFWILPLYILLEDYLKIVEFIEWLKDFYPETAEFLTKNA